MNKLFVKIGHRIISSLLEVFTTKMRAVIQRVKNASVTEIISKINRGFCILIGLASSDKAEDIEYIVKKITSLKLFEVDGQQWSGNIRDVDGEILCVSQFTLYANTKKGAKPDFHLAMKSNESREMYLHFFNSLKLCHPKVQDGKFGADMDVALVNDGPITIIIDSQNK